MQESARAAVSYARANLDRFGIRESIFENVDIHIHVPAGAIPKDGPSAGIAMATALISVFTNTPVRNDIAMTGEVTLRGRVLPIGGLKEKALGALRQGIKTLIIPEKNQRDLVEIPKQIKRKIKFVPVKDMQDVISYAIDAKFDRPKIQRVKKKRR
jgi:ATP-dependent Lon protease